MSEELITITKAMLHNDITGYSSDKDRTRALGIPWPLKKGWKHGLIGRKITQEQYDKFFIYKSETPLLFKLDS